MVVKNWEVWGFLVCTMAAIVTESTNAQRALDACSPLQWLQWFPKHV